MNQHLFQKWVLIIPAVILVQNGQFLDSCISLGTNSGYSASKDDLVYIEGGNEGVQVDASRENAKDMAPQNAVVDRSAEFIIEFQVSLFKFIFYFYSVFL